MIRRAGTLGTKTRVADSRGAGQERLMIWRAGTLGADASRGLAGSAAIAMAFAPERWL